MKDLVERLENATGPAYALDVAIYDAIGRKEPMIPPAYTASVDEALTLFTGEEEAFAALADAAYVSLTKWHTIRRLIVTALRSRSQQPTGDAQ